MHTSNQLNWTVDATKAVPSLPDARVTRTALPRNVPFPNPHTIHQTHRCSYGKPTAFESNFRTAVSKGARHCVRMYGGRMDWWVYIYTVEPVLQTRGHLSTSGKVSRKLRLGSERKIFYFCKLKMNHIIHLAPSKLSGHFFPQEQFACMQMNP